MTVIETKRCQKCERELPLEGFNRDRKRPDGLQNRCRECANEYNQRYYLENRERVLERQAATRAANPERVREYSHARYQAHRVFTDEVVKSLPCLDCGRTLAPREMHFHHVREPKLFNVGERVVDPLDALRAEIAKCELLCASCHIARHKTLQAPEGDQEALAEASGLNDNQRLLAASTH